MSAPICEKCGNDGTKGTLYVTIDARWDHENKCWILDARDDEGGQELDCLNCDHRTEGPEFPYGATVQPDVGTGVPYP